MIGIYLIRNPLNACYVGQSIDIERRWKSYKRLDCKSQRKLYQSLVFFGVQNHEFIVLVRCYKWQLNIFERFFQKLYNSTGENGLNCKLTNDKIK